MWSLIKSLLPSVVGWGVKWFSMKWLYIGGSVVIGGAFLSLWLMLQSVQSERDAAIAKTAVAQQSIEQLRDSLARQNEAIENLRIEAEKQDEKSNQAANDVLERGKKITGRNGPEEMNQWARKLESFAR